MAKKHAGFSFLCPVGWCKSDGVAFSGEGQTALNNLYGHLVRKFQRDLLSLWLNHHLNDPRLSE